MLSAYVADETLYPLVGFFFTFPEYRGNRCGGKLLAYAAEEVRKQGYQRFILPQTTLGYMKNTVLPVWKTAWIFTAKTAGSM